jgi:glycosyltransferase involved in cell wall biosynthesis
MSKNPQITVLMPVYNVSLYVKQAIESILNQTYTDFELLIINDGSSDNTRDEVLKISDERIRFEENEINIGLANTLNKGIELARGKYIARMDGDDISKLDRLEKQFQFLENNPDIDICGAGYEFFGSKNYKVTYPEVNENIKIGLLFGCCMIIPLYRRASILQAGLRYDQEYFPAEDYRFWTECMLKGLKMHNIQETLFRYRMHSTQVSEVMTNQTQMTIKVRTHYFKSLFPAVDELLTSQFINDFVASPIEKLSDFDEQHNIIDSLEMINQKQLFIQPLILKAHLKKHLSIKLSNYVNEYWFATQYTLPKLIQLFSMGVFFKLPVKFRTKLVLKCIVGKK